MTQGPSGPEYIPSKEERKRNREKARQASVKKQGLFDKRAAASVETADGKVETRQAVSTATVKLDEHYVQASDYEKLRPKVRRAREQNIQPDETIRVIVGGAHGQAMVGTDGRVFVCKPGFMAGATFGAEVTSWSYQNLLGVQAHKGMMSGSVVLQGPGQTGTKTSYWGQGKDDPKQAPNAIPVAGDWQKVNAGVARLRQLIDDAHRPAPAAAQTAAPSSADELRKFAELREEGILSDEEFQKAKARILGGLTQNAQ